MKVESTVIPVSVVIPTCNRWLVLERTIRSLLAQEVLPFEIIVIDASGVDQSACFHALLADSIVKGNYVKATTSGATHQRIQGIQVSNQPFVWLVDDDIILQPECTRRLFCGFEMVAGVGAVSAMIINQQYGSPGLFSRFMFRFMSGVSMVNYAGKVIGPAWNLLPADSDNLPEYVRCDWLNTTCTMYRKEVLPAPVFADFFTGYSMFEDLALSAEIGKSHVLLNARTARIFHDSQPGNHKSDVIDLSRMALINRYWVMTRVLGRTGAVFICKLAILDTVGVLTSLRNVAAWRKLPSVLWGKIAGWVLILGRGKSL